MPDGGFQVPVCARCGHTEGDHRSVPTPRTVLVGVCLVGIRPGSTLPRCRCPKFLPAEEAQAA